MRILLSIVLVLFVASLTVVGIAGFQGHRSRKPPIEVFPDMDRQPKLRPQKPDPFFANGVSSQLPPPGTIARSLPIQSSAVAVYRFEDSPVNTGRITGTTNFVENNPLPVTGLLLERGRDRYAIYCTPCHGALADGNGVMRKIGALPAVANLHDKRIVEMTDGEIFNTVTVGKGLMGAYGPLMPAEDRWAIIAYVRALQLSQLGSLDDLTPQQQAVLKK